MQVQLSELQQKLSGEVEEKGNFARINAELEQAAQIKTAEIDQMYKELSEERSKKEELSTKIDELSGANVKLQQLLATSQDALAKENSVVSSLQEKLGKVTLQSMFAVWL